MSQPLNDDEPELRAAFARQRAGDHAEAPAWRAEWLQAPVKDSRPASPRVRWMPAALAVACVALALATVAGLPLFKPQPRLSEVLPPLFDDAAPGGVPELFADLGPSFLNAESPSDFLLPDSLSTSPTPNLP